VSKDQLRIEFRKKLESLTEDQILNLRLSLTNQIIKFFQIYPELQSQTGGGFLPLPKEMAPVFQELLKVLPLTLAYPVNREGEMKFALPEETPKGMIWLEEPGLEVAPSWVFVPGLGFDLKGARLGRGRGFYDSYLKNHRTISIALACDQQLGEHIPMESHDYHMDFIITENFCWNVKQQTKF
jgi:5-formyltetrahydrofolate cyclo-ligase